MLGSSLHYELDRAAFGMLRELLSECRRVSAELETRGRRPIRPDLLEGLERALKRHQPLIEIIGGNDA